MNFRYDEAGNRIAKITCNAAGTPVHETWYARDPAGNVLAVYEKDPQTTDPAELVEYPIYGAGRIGLMRPTGVNSDGQTTYDIEYELTDHLGNVRATIKANPQYYVYDYLPYEPIFTSTADYYPYGLSMPGRSWVSGVAYRYGYQGQFSEKDAETDWNAFKLRMYDANIGRWLTTDPYREFSSSYIGMAGNPVSAMDPDGGRTTGGGTPETGTTPSPGGSTATHGSSGTWTPSTAHKVNWGLFTNGALMTFTGTASVVAGVTTPPNPFTVPAITFGVTSAGLGTTYMALGLYGYDVENTTPGGFFELLENSMGYDGTYGQITDIIIGGKPLSNLERMLFINDIYNSNVGNMIFNNHNVPRPKTLKSVESKPDNTYVSPVYKPVLK